MSKFNNLSTALSYRDHCVSPSMWSIIMGDDELFWFVTNREASRLMKQGYELAA